VGCTSTVTLPHHLALPLLHLHMISPHRH
jgi:hypothetical protein